MTEYYCDSTAEYNGNGLFRHPAKDNGLDGCFKTLDGVNFNSGDIITIRPKADKKVYNITYYNIRLKYPTKPIIISNNFKMKPIHGIISNMVC